MHYGALQSYRERDALRALPSKKSLLLWGEILYSDVSNNQSKFLNNFLM
jgi:hypothetical protein